MAVSPRYKVFNPSGEYVASCKYVEDAATVAGSYGEGAEIRTSHARRHTVWREGHEETTAGDSVDRVCEIIHAREEAP